MRVLEAALEVIAERGVPDTRIADIADRAEMSAGHVLYYFGSKAGILLEVLQWNEDRFHAELQAELRRKRSARRRLEAVIRASVPTKRGDPHWLLWLEVWAMAPHDEALLQKQGLQEGRFHEVLAEVIRQGQESGEFTVAVDPDLAASRLSALLDGLAIRVVIGSKDVDPRTMLRLATAEARMLLSGDGRT
jgi:AcrR family transcriptional regulator